MRKSKTVSAWTPPREMSTQVERSSVEGSEKRSYSIERQVTNGLRSSSGGSCGTPHMTLYNTVIEEKIIIEQVDTSGSRLAEQHRISTEEKIGHCSSSVKHLLQWLTSIEKELSAQELLRECLDEVKQQMSALKFIQDDLWSHSTDVNDSLAQIRTLTADDSSPISPQSMATLDDSAEQLKKRFERVGNYADQLNRKATNAFDQLNKYEHEKNAFSDWLKKSCHTLVDFEKNIKNLKVNRQEKINEFVTDVTTHKAELRFLEITANRFLDSTQEHLSVLNEMRSTLSQRLPALRKKSSTVQDEFSKINGVYNDLVDRSSKLGDKLCFGRRQKEFQSAVDEAIDWLKKVTPRVQVVVDEELGSNPKETEEQLRRSKHIKEEIVAKSVLITTIRQTGESLVNVLPPGEKANVQKSCKDIEGKYESLLSTLTTKMQFFDSGSTLLNKISDNLKTLRNVLEKAEGRLPSNLIGTSRQEVESINRTLQQILSSLEDNSTLVDTTRAFINELLRKGQGNEQLRVDFTEFQSRWGALEGNLKERVSYTDLIKQFFDLQDLLRSWLDTKDKSLHGLGPITSNARLAAEQRQQLKSLREDIRTQEGKVKEFNGAGETILKWSAPKKPERVKIEDTMSGINQKWKTLLKKLEEREGNVEDVIGSTKDFDRNLRKLEESLRGVSNDLDGLSRTKLRPEEVLKQLTALERALDQQRPVLTSLESSGEKLLELLRDPSSKADVKQKLVGVARLFNDCTKKVDILRNEAEDSEKEIRDFNGTLLDAQKWMDHIFPQLEKVCISADRQILKQQLRQYELLSQEIQSKKTEIQKILSRGKDLTKLYSHIPNLENLQQSWAKLEKEGTASHSRLQRCHERYVKYDKSHTAFCNWLSNSEEKLNQIRISSLRKSEIEKNMREMDEFKKEMIRHGNDFKEALNFGETFVTGCDRDKDGVLTEFEEMEKRWEALQRDIQKRIQELENLREKLGTFNENVATTKRAMDRCETQMLTSENMPKVKEIGEELIRVEKLLDGIQRQLDGLCKIGDSHGCDTEHVQKVVDDLFEHFRKIKSQLDSRAGELEAEKKMATSCKEKVIETNNAILDLEREFNTFKGIGRTITIVEGQMKELQDFRRRYVKVNEEFEEMVAHVGQLAKRGANTTRLTPEIEMQRKKLLQLNGKIKQRDVDLENMLKKLEDFYRLYKSTDKELSELSRLAPSIDTLTAMQEWKRREVAGVGKEVDEVNGLGRSLLKSSASVSTTTLEADMDKLNDKWKAFNEMITVRRSALERGQMRAKELEDTLGGLMTALKQIDALVLQDGRVHGDVDTVKTLINQHKGTEEQLQNRRIQMQNIFKSASELTEKTLSAEEKCKVSSQVMDVKEYFEKVSQKVEERTQKLEGALKDAEKLSGSVQTLFDFFAKMEKKKRAFPQSFQNVDELTSLKLLEEQEKFGRDLSSMEREKHGTVEFGRRVLTKAHANAVSTVKTWLSTIDLRWNDLSTWTTTAQRRLQEHLATLRENAAAVQELLLWLRQREDKLTKLESTSLPHELDEVVGLVKEHIAFMEILDHRRSDVNAAADFKAVGKRIGGGSGLSQRLQSLSLGRDSKSKSLFTNIGPNFDESPEPACKTVSVKALWEKWRHVWTLSWERQRRLEVKYQELMRRFSWEDWRKRFTNYNRERVRGLFTKVDRKNAGLIGRVKFIEVIRNTDFPTSEEEVGHVATKFAAGEEEVDYWKFITALRADWAEKKPVVEATLINNEIQQQVKKCACKQRFRVEQVAEGSYRFGESQRLRLVRILRSTVMVRVGGGWESLEEFLLKNDPCRAKGRTNVELREQLQLKISDGATEILAAFTAKRKGDAEALRTRSPSPAKQPERGSWKYRANT